MGARFFSVEQHVKFWTYAVEVGDRLENRWSGIMCSDFGRIGANPPWAVSPFAPKDTAEFFSPFASDLAARSVKADLTKNGEQIYPRPNPFASRVTDDMAMSQMDRELCTRDPFVFLADLLDTSALCWMQVLSFLRDSFEQQPNDPHMKVKLLGRDKRLLDRGIRYFTETIRLIESRDQSRGRLEWPICLERDALRVDEIARSLVQDFETLREDAQALSSMFQDATGIVMSMISVESSQQSLLESKRIQLVTYLAFLFVPTGVIGSFFGMNVEQLSHEPSIWYPIGASFIAMIVSIVTILWLERKTTVKRYLSKFRQHPSHPNMEMGFDKTRKSEFANRDVEQ
ncbi:hypothetical protein GGR53DRAFT_104345 [Hypoxylon sp. FL1150]|nr:hypothetical protein GGR53DRAFT_104345 [Hypoxylon sp. FL1150]